MKRAWVYLATIIGLANCSTSWEQDVAKRVCPAVVSWVEAGPRNITGDRRLSLPDAYDYEAEPDTVTITAFAWNYNCPEGVMCEDENDIALKDTLRVYAHSASSFTYFTILEGCMRGNLIDIYNHERDASNISKTKVINDVSVTLNWDAENSQTDIILTYPLD